MVLRTLTFHLSIPNYYYRHLKNKCPKSRVKRKFEDAFATACDLHFECVVEVKLSCIKKNHAVSCHTGIFVGK